MVYFVTHWQNVVCLFIYVPGILHCVFFVIVNQSIFNNAPIISLVIIFSCPLSVYANVFKCNQAWQHVKEILSYSSFDKSNTKANMSD